MRFQRFQFINAHITCINEKDVVVIKVKKCPKLVQGLENLFKSIYLPGEFLSIDEGMMPFKGRMKNRVYSPIKPYKWGMKFYVLAESTTGYILNLRIVGEQSSINDTVLSLCNNLEGKYRKLFMENFYNSYKLTQLLYERKIYCTGTLRHRRGSPENLLSLNKQVSSNSHIFRKNFHTNISLER